MVTAGLLARVEADENQRKGEFVVMVQGRVTMRKRSWHTAAASTRS